MSDNLKKTKPQDASRINVNEVYELEYWSKTLGVSKEKLKATVKKAGVSAEAVRKALSDN
jgi:uncharacterized protein DUF3606